MKITRGCALKSMLQAGKTCTLLLASDGDDRDSGSSPRGVETAARLGSGGGARGCPFLSPWTRALSCSRGHLDDDGFVRDRTDGVPTTTTLDVRVLPGHTEEEG
jgi:hypothetical protein